MLNSARVSEACFSSSLAPSDPYRPQYIAIGGIEKLQGLYLLRFNAIESGLAKLSWPFCPHHQLAGRISAQENRERMPRDGGFHPFKGRVSRHFGDSLSPDDAYLSYYDTRLTKEDVDTLKDDWLTDNANDLLLGRTPNPHTLREALPDFTRTTHIFLPINDARNVSVAEGGSHWSLLLVSIIDGVAFHYDSMSPSNYNEAANATHKLSTLIGKPLRFMNLDDSPQQENGSDCGVYVCIQMRHLLLKRLLSANAKEKISMSMGGKMVDANGGRKEMLRIIETFRKEGERRRSNDEYRSSSASKSKGKKSVSRSPPRIDS
ncbi:hypothetical protein V501_07077 [Pseudogymnoascus sp. VKM F-4519 (FW-2642)]|nr:hypothetical protein V501_07077 [Pseudogymnoascus sp. VKM F-4519 (FW-2642)]